MTVSYESWAESFHFSEDLKALEAVYHAEHQEALKQQLSEKTARRVMRSPLDNAPKDAQFLEQLSSQIADRLGQSIVVSDTASLKQQFETLRHDNHVMAKQIDQLLKRISHLEAENMTLRQRIATFQPLWKNLFIKRPLPGRK